MKRSLDLLSERSCQRNQLRRCLRMWTRIVCGTLTIVTLAGFIQWNLVNQTAAKQASYEADYEPIRQLKLENTRLKKQTAELEKAEIIPLKLAVHQPLCALLGLTSQAVVEQQQRVYLEELAIERAPLDLEPLKEPLTTVVFEGFALDKTSLEEVADSMRQLGPFSDVQLYTETDTTVGSDTALSFSIECTNQPLED